MKYIENILSLLNFINLHLMLVFLEAVPRCPVIYVILSKVRIKEVYFQIRCEQNLIKPALMIQLISFLFK